MTSLAAALECERLAALAARYDALRHWIANDLAEAQLAAGEIDAAISRQTKPEPRA